MQTVMLETNKPDMAERKKGLESLVLKQMPVDFLAKPKPEFA